MNIEELFKNIEKEKASDLFIIGGKCIYYRTFGRLTPYTNLQFSSEEIAEFRRKVLLPQAEKEFTEKGSYDAGLTFPDGSRFRINFFIQQGNYGLIARPVPAGNLRFEDLNIPNAVASLADVNRGLILITGPAGSGKSSTVAAILHAINEKYNKHIITIEDPIEFVHTDNKSLITQREVGVDTVSFADALRHVVRESPDVISIGEMRDLETMQTAVSAALTGHLVISTLHTANTVQCIERIINHFPERQREQIADDIAMALEAIVAQRLVQTADNKSLLPSFEILRATPFVRRLIATRQFTEIEDAMKQGKEEGMITFNRYLSDLVKEGKITVKVGAEAATNKEEFYLLVQGMESGIETFRDLLDDDISSSDKNEINMKRLLHSAVANEASDLIITAGAPPAIRINGEINYLAVNPLTPGDTRRLLFSVLSPRQRVTFEEQKEIDFALTVNIKRKKDKNKEPVSYRFRINGFYQRGNTAVAVRVIPRTILKPEALGIPEIVLKLVDKQQGLLLVTGPTGHGKSTTLASLIDRINTRRSCHIITVEDPIEYVHKNKKSVVEQREVHADTNSFPNALKYVLRQDPDVILIGEMRDIETISAALTAAETGHLVMATLHTNNAVQSIDRIIDSFPAHQQNQIRLQLSGCLIGIISQRLIPLKNGKTRTAAFEVLVATTPVKALIRDAKPQLIPATMETSAKDGMITMQRALKDLYTADLISKEDYIAYSTELQTPVNPIQKLS